MNHHTTTAYKQLFISKITDLKVHSNYISKNHDSKVSAKNMQFPWCKLS